MKGRKSPWLIASLNILTVFLIIITYAISVFLPQKKLLTHSIEQEFKANMRLKSSLFDNAIKTCIDQARSISSRSMIRAKLVDYMEGRVTREQLIAFTKPRFLDGVKIFENCIFASRMVDSIEIARYSLLPADSIPELLTDSLIVQKKVRFLLRDRKVYLLVSSCIDGDKGTIGHDYLCFEMNSVVSQLSQDKIDFRISLDPDTLFRRMKKLQFADSSSSLIYSGEEAVYSCKSGYASVGMMFSQKKGWLYMDLNQFYKNQFLIILFLLVSTLLILFIIQRRTSFVFRHENKRLEEMVAFRTEELRQSLEQLSNAHAEIERNERHLKALFHYMSHSFLLCRTVTDNAGIASDLEIAMVNPQFESLINARSAGLEGKRLSELFKLNHEELFAKFCRIGNGGPPVKEEFYSFAVKRYLKATGYCPGGNFVAIILEDISREKETELQLRQLNDHKKMLLSIIAHDLRNPLAAVIGYTDLMSISAHDYSPEKLAEMAGLANKSAERVVALFNELLEWARIQADDFNPVFSSVSLARICLEVRESLQSSLDKKQLHFTIAVPADMIVFADHNMIKTVVRNLVNNAIKFTKETGNIMVEARFEEEKVIVSVIDTGIGIPAEKLVHLFQPGSEHRYGTSGEGGFGLGLLICKTLIEKHHGRIWAESEEGKGSRFSFEWPAQRDDNS